MPSRAGCDKTIAPEKLHGGSYLLRTRQVNAPERAFWDSKCGQIDSQQLQCAVCNDAQRMEHDGLRGTGRELPPME